MSVHKRMVQVSVDDYGVVGGRLREMAEEDRRELWYEEGRQMVVFRGTSLDDLKTFAEKCKAIIKELQDERLGPEGIMEKKELHELAQEKIGEARNMVFEKKVHAFEKLGIIEEKSIELNRDDAQFVLTQFKSLQKIYPCDGKFHKLPQDMFELRIKGFYPHAENLARHAGQLLKERWEAREEEDGQAQELAAKLRRTRI